MHEGSKYSYMFLKGKIICLGRAVFLLDNPPAGVIAATMLAIRAEEEEVVQCISEKT